MVVSYRLSIVTIVLSLTIRPQFAVECLRRSNQQGVGQFDAKFGEEAVDRCEPMKLCRYLQLFEHSAWTWQTNRQTDHWTVTAIAIGEIAYQRCRLNSSGCRNQLSNRARDFHSYRLTWRHKDRLSRVYHRPVGVASLRHRSLCFGQRQHQQLTMLSVPCQTPEKYASTQLQRYQKRRWIGSTDPPIVNCNWPIAQSIIISSLIADCIDYNCT